MAYVYRHIRLDTNTPFYIGIGSDNNFNRAYEKTKNKRSAWWNRIVNKHGYDVEILFENVSPKFAKEKEKEFIELYGRMDLKNGTLCNYTDGGDGMNGWKAPTETIERMKVAAKIRGTWMLNTPEIIGKRANSMRGKKRTDEQKEKLAAWQRGVKKPKESIEKMRATLLLPENVEKRRNQPNCKKVLCLDNGVTYRSCAEAGRQLKIERSAISMCCLGVRGKAKGLKFIYAFEQEIKELKTQLKNK